jgi:D-alanyl-lipoteichoic acid acyltransferase DltB (MBOAT superfamily)
MLFPTIQFAVFFTVVLTANWLLMPHPRQWRWFMLAASYVFYGAWNWRYLGLLVATTVINQVAALAIARASADERRRRGALIAAIVGNLGILGWFKYYGFFLASAVNALAAIGVDAPLPLFQILLPVGISFFTFQAMSYTIDVFRRELEPARNMDFAVYLSFFPQLVAGPIVRGTEFLPQLRTPRDPRDVDGVRAFGLIAGGLFKKVVIANLLATTIVDQVFASPAQFSALEILFAVYGYAVQIYADFSGYTDIAIGVALLLGFRFPQNFNAPYAAVSLQDFWRRWHMTLSRWLRDYLYIPLGGSRGSEPAVYRNLMLTMVLGGLWHGAAWTFVVWGGLHGAGLAIERYVSGRRRAISPIATPVPALDPAPATSAASPASAASPGAADPPSRWSVLGRQVLTFHLVCLAWIFFRADSLGTVGTIMSRLVTAWGPAPAVTPLVVGLIALGIGVQYLPRELSPHLERGLARLRPVALAGMLAAGLLLVDALGPQGIAPFIYFQF